MTFNDEECYELFIAVDDRARLFRGARRELNALRERLLPFYRDWHAANPHKIHPSAMKSDT